MNFLMAELFKNIMDGQYSVSGNQPQEKFPILRLTEHNEVTAFSQLLHLMCEASMPESVQHLLAEAAVAETHSPISYLQDGQAPETDDVEKVVSAVSVLLHKWMEYVDSTGDKTLSAEEEGMTLPLLWQVMRNGEDHVVSELVVESDSEFSETTGRQESRPVSIRHVPDSTTQVSVMSLRKPMSSHPEETDDLTPKVSFAFPMERLVMWLMSIDSGKESSIESSIMRKNLQAPFNGMEPIVNSNSNISFTDDNVSVPDEVTPIEDNSDTELVTETLATLKMVPEDVPMPAAQMDIDSEVDDTGKVLRHSEHRSRITPLYPKVDRGEVEPVAQKEHEQYQSFGVQKLTDESNESSPEKAEVKPGAERAESTAPSRRFAEQPAVRQVMQPGPLRDTGEPLEVSTTLTSDESDEPEQKVDFRTKRDTVLHSDPEEVELEKTTVHQSAQQDKAVHPVRTETRTSSFISNSEESLDTTEIDHTKPVARTGLRNNNPDNLGEIRRAQVVSGDSEVESEKVDISRPEAPIDSSKKEHTLDNEKPAVNVPVSQIKNREPLLVLEKRSIENLNRIKPSRNRQEPVENVMQKLLSKTSSDELVTSVTEASGSRRQLVLQRQKQHSGMLDVELDTELEAMSALRTRVAEMLHKSLRDKVDDATQGKAVRVQFDRSTDHGAIVRLVAKDADDRMTLQQLWRHLVLRVTTNEADSNQDESEPAKLLREVFRSGNLVDETKNETRSYPIRRLIQNMESKLPEHLSGWVTSLRQKLEQPVLNDKDVKLEDVSRSEASAGGLIRSLERAGAKAQTAHVNVFRHNLERNPERLPEAMRLPYRQESLFQEAIGFRSVNPSSTIMHQSESTEVPGEAAEITRPVVLGVNRSVFNLVEQAIASERSTVEYPTRVPLDQLGRESVEAIRQLLGGREQRINIKLHPESLGEVQIEVRSRQGEMSIRLLSGSATVREALEHQMGGLREALSREGLEVQRIEVSSQPGSNPANDGAHNAGREAQRQDASQRGGYRFTNSDNASDQESSRGFDRRRRHQGNLNVFV